jgi:hypothetical protein
MPSRLAVVASFLLAGCERSQTYTTTVELVDIEHFGEPPATAQQVNFELRYADCPGDNRRILRGGKDLAACTKDLKEGARVPLEILSKYSSEKGGYRSEVKKIAGCPVKWDPKEEANYEMTSVCTDIETTGAVVGVHCDRSRPKALVEKCPFLRRK